MTESSSTSFLENNGSRNHPSRTKKHQWDQWGTRPYTVMPHVSPASKEIAETYQLRPTDVVVLSFPKTGTTWTQTVCEQLRTNAEGYDGFGDITERQPWLEFAYDCGQDLDDDVCGIPRKGAPEDTSGDAPNGPILTPRIFKSHQLLSAINPGGKYLCIVRDPAATLLSWFAFQKAKGRPGYAEYEDANEYIAKRSELFDGNCIFGTNIWEMYAEVWSARKDPSVKTLVYEGLIADAPNGYMDHLPVIADFLGIEQDFADEDAARAFYQRVAHLVSREEMVRNVDKFDDHFIAEMGKRYGRALRILEPAAKVRKKTNNKLSEATLEWLEDRWMERMTPKTGHASYDEFATDLSEWFFGEAEDDSARTAAGEAVAGQTETETTPRQRKSSNSAAMRRKSSLVIQQMPRIRQRRESLAPLE